MVMQKDPCTGCEQYDATRRECRASLDYLEHNCIYNATDKQLERYGKELQHYGKRYTYI